MPSFLIFAKWQWITFASSLMNVTGILNELMILVMSWLAAYGKLNLLFCVTDDLTAKTLGWSR